ncbi:MAG TPA: CmpA/NrtA family ABC transporter substrate-binding protein [Candidatus Binatia bacterium]|nr:CmpA/NrtA family ABC transporter substrate-binding protein [Candidatus Binatia bacterium]
MRKSAPYTLRSLSRRQFLQASGLAALFAHLPVGWAGRVFASDAPETPQLRIGIIALTDCSSIVVAYEKGFFKEQGLDVTVSKEASWAVIRDKLQLGENQATHMLYGMPYASSMGLFGAPVKPMIIPWAINYNGQAITLNNDLKDKGVRTPGDLRKVIDEEKAAGKPPRTFAMTFPPGTHAMWMRYWLGSGGIDPDKDVSLITIPPPQMVANMKVGKMDGFCVGEPWNARAIADSIGFTAITSQALWLNHPEKVCAFTAEFAEKNPKTVKAVLKALHQSSVFIDKLENRPEVAEIVSRPAYINCPKEIILGRLLGKYDHGDGSGEHEDKDYMRFFERGVNFPWKSHGVWWLTQFRRWGMVKGTPNYTNIVNHVHRPDIYREVAKEMGFEAPAEDFKTEQLFDGVAFDPTKPEEYAKAFAVKNTVEA